jgi:ribosomal protein S18 acetylase RimI-like enzyme
MRVRPAVPADAESIATINVYGWQAAYAGLMPAELLDAMEIGPRAESMRSWLSRDDAERLARPGQTLVAVDGTGAVAGYTHYGPLRGGQPGDGEIYAIYVRPDTLGAGAGTAMMTRALADLAAQGRTTVRLWVLAGNDRACRFYERCGFAADGLTRVDEVSLPGGGTTGLAELRYTRRG